MNMAHASMRQPAQPAAIRQPRRSSVLVTASYAPDFERCRLLCETVDRQVTGHAAHLILVEGRDVPLFRGLAGPRRHVVDERDLLPGWLRGVADPLSLFRRRIWLSLKTVPLRGWHVQQLRRIAIARHVTEDALVYCDSDVAFTRRFDTASFWQGDAIRLLRRDGGLPLGPGSLHPVWSANAARVLGIEPAVPSPHDYIGTVIGWRRDTVLSMVDRIEEIAGRQWVEAVAASRQFSECTIYGRYVDEVLGGDGHFADATELCRVAWGGDQPIDEPARFIAGAGPHQVAVGIQSFIGVDIGEIRKALAL